MEEGEWKEKNRKEKEGYVRYRRKMRIRARRTNNRRRLRSSHLRYGSLLSCGSVFDIGERGSGFRTLDSVLGFDVEGVTASIGVDTIITEDFYYSEVTGGGGS